MPSVFFMTVQKSGVKKRRPQQEDKKSRMKEKPRTETALPKTDLSPIAEILEEYKEIPGSLIKVLQQTQNIYGYIPKDAIIAISKALKIKPAKIMGVITFYAQFRLNPIGK